MLVADPALFPTPWATLQTGYPHLVSGDLLFQPRRHPGARRRRLRLAMVIGSAIGIALGRSQPADAIFGGWLSIGLNMPALVTIVLCYVWFGLTETAAIVAVTINKAPTVAAIMREGAGRSTASCWRPPRSSTFRAGRCCAMSSCRNWRRASSPRPARAWRSPGRSCWWSSCSGRPNGVGFQIRTFFNYFDIAGILAYSLAFIAIVLAIENFIMQPIERRHRTLADRMIGLCSKASRRRFADPAASNGAQKTVLDDITSRSSPAPS